MSTGPAFRAVRAAIFAAACVLTAGLGHTLMSGRTLPGWALAAAFGGTAGAAWWLTGRERGALVVTGSAVAAQLGLHTLFRMARPGTGQIARPAAADGMAAMPGMDVGDAPHYAVTVVGHVDPPPGMLLAHALAALVCGLWLSHGEAAVFRLGRSLAAAVFAPLRRAWTARGCAGPELPVRRPAGAAGTVRPPRGALLRHAVSRRGPPAPRVCR